MLWFEWDEAKNELNRSKHGIWFEEAQSVFDDPMARAFLDPDHSNKEDRFLIIGVSSSGRLLIVVHGYGKAASVIRLIPAWKVTRKERKVYEERI